jgi:uncharacterized protein
VGATEGAAWHPPDLRAVRGRLSFPPTMTVHEFTIPTGDLDSGGHEYVFPVRASWMRASKSGNDVVVHGTLKAALTVPCARCLEPVSFEVAEPVSVLFSPRSALRGREGAAERELTAEEADTLPYDGETVVLDDLVRDELILQTPSFPLCSDDCPGIRPSPEKADEATTPLRDVDPRLLPLMRILEPKE